ncbi:piRNA biogenesis protein EXD1 [Notolabrus celidotus]|uniref:piRNA biogenesis protein EXD1 n=1 Tax=Notolabrus celidotus TaxID=1203425 RepID=UPI001490368A|nr:piRNA biogenesis protein EXD1 [Notolabrus celidotus]
MGAEDVEFLNTLKGKRVKLTLKTSSYIGVVQRINSNKTLILADVSGNTGCKLAGSKLFFGREILNVEFSNDANTHSGNAQDHRIEEHLNVEKFQPYRKIIPLVDDEDEEEHIKFAVIDEFHEKFWPAVMDIKKQQVIGVGVNGIQVYQHGRLCWLQIATKNKVYLFDILVLGAQAFKNGLTMILESKHILKVIQDCRAISGCLFAQFGVQLTNVFDTQVADVMCFYSKTGGYLPDRVSTLQEVVSLHLKVPSSQLMSLQMMSQLTKEEQEMWQKRPCPVPLLKVMALSVIHLQPLRLVLLDALMMDYMALVDSYINSSHFQPDELKHVTMESVLELPEELRQLEQMHLEKQEWAAARYPVTEKGLLDRFHPRAQSSSNTSSAAEQYMQTELDSFEPAPSSTPVDLSPRKPLVSPPHDPDVMSVNDTVSPEPAAKAPVHAPPSDPSKQMSSRVPPSGGRGCMEVQMDALGRGRPFGKDSSVSLLPTIGRGFLLQMSQAQTGDRVTAPLGPNHAKVSTGVKPHDGPDRLEDASGFSAPQSLSSPPLRPFRPFSF